MRKKIIVLLSMLAIICCSLCFIGCSGIKATAPENLAYDGSYLTWSRCDNAKYYNVSINGGQEVRCNSTTYVFTSNETVEVTVTAVYEKEEKSTSETFIPLETISNVYVADDGRITWDSIGGATAYSVSINGQIKTVTDTAFEQLEVGNNRIKIKPIVQDNPSFYSFWSEEKVVFIYTKPSSVKYDGTTISWNGNAPKYLVTVNGIPNEVTGNTMEFNSERNDFTVSLKALGDHQTYFDSDVVEEEFHYLDTVTELIVQDGVLNWNEIDGAEGYLIKIDGVVFSSVMTNTKYQDLPAGRSVDVAIMPINTSGNYFSSWSSEKTIYILETPVTSWNNDLELDGDANNNFVWDAVNAAQGYTVRLTKNGNLVDEYSFSEIQRYFAEAYSEVAIYTVQVKANAMSGSSDYYDSKYSEPITVERLPAPKATTNGFITSEKDNLAAGFVVNFIQVSGASEYQLYKDGVLLAGKKTSGSALNDNNVADSENLGQQQYTYMVRSMGGIKNVSGKTYVTLSCLTSQALSFNITVQATPQHLEMSGFTLGWDAVAGNNGYCIAYAGAKHTAQTESYDLSTIKAGDYDVTLCARGNGGSTLASNFSSPITIQRLSAPTEIKINSSSNGTLEWKDVSNAKGYEVYLGLSQTALDENSYDNMYQFIDTAGTTLTMLASANYYNELHTIYFMTSEASATQQFIRLAAPTFPEGALANSIELLWNSPTNINTEEYTPVYNLYSAINEQIGGGSVNGTKFNIEYLEAGSHNFYVKAIGNDTKYLDSEYSVVKSVYKLATPQLNIKDGKYVWKGVANASSYYLEIDGKKVSDEFHVSGEDYAYTPRFTSAGEHIVILKAMGDGRNNVNSKPYTWTQLAQVLTRPEITANYSAENFVQNGTISVSIAEAIKNCVKYQYEIAGESSVSEQLTYSKVIVNTGEYVIRVKALGGSFDINNVYYIDSEYAGGNGEYKITLLGTPEYSKFSINSDGVIKWGDVSGCAGYDYQLSFNGEDYSEIQHRAYTSLEMIENYKTYATISVRVRATGSADGKVISSAWIEWTWTNPNI